MSVYIRPDSKDGFYSYDFRLSGRRFSGSTGTSVRREAQRIEKQLREEAKLLIAAEAAAQGSDLTVRGAISRFWQEVGQHHADPRTTMRNLTWLEKHFGAETALSSVDDARIAAMVARRRGEYVPQPIRNKRKKSSAKPAPPKRVSPATVNRTATQPMRQIMLRAERLWSARVQRIRWRDHLLPEPQERVREARPDEESAAMQELERGYDDAVEFAFRSGCRRMEIIGLIWQRIDFFNRRYQVIGKGGRSRFVPMTEETFALLWRQQGHHPEKVFTYAAKRTVKRKNGDLIMRGTRYALTDAGLRSAMRRAVVRADVKDFRFHDTRHTAATRVLRKSNLRVVQKLLGHADITTTTKYAHALEDDIRGALQAVDSSPLADLGPLARNDRNKA